jgi:hypothetical protein
LRRLRSERSWRYADQVYVSVSEYEPAACDDVGADTNAASSCSEKLFVPVPTVNGELPLVIAPGKEPDPAVHELVVELDVTPFPQRMYGSVAPPGPAIANDDPVVFPEIVRVAVVSPEQFNVSVVNAVRLLSGVTPGVMFGNVRPLFEFAVHVAATELITALTGIDDVYVAAVAGEASAARAAIASAPRGRFFIGFPFESYE